MTSCTWSHPYNTQEFEFEKKGLLKPETSFHYSITLVFFSIGHSFMKPKKKHPHERPAFVSSIALSLIRLISPTGFWLRFFSC